MKFNLGLILLLLVMTSCSKNAMKMEQSYFQEITGIPFSENSNYLVVNFEGCQTCVVYAQNFLNDFVFKEIPTKENRLIIILTGFPSKKWLRIKMPNIDQYTDVYYDDIEAYNRYSLNLSYPLVYSESTKELIEVSSDKIAIYETLKFILKN